MKKSELRDRFTAMKPYIKFRPFLQELGIQTSNFSHFMNYEVDGFVNQDDLDKLYNLIVETLDKVA